MMIFFQIFFFLNDNFFGISIPFAVAFNVFFSSSFLLLKLYIQVRMFSQIKKKLNLIWCLNIFWENGENPPSPPIPLELTIVLVMISVSFVDDAEDVFV